MFELDFDLSDRFFLHIQDSAGELGHVVFLLAESEGREA
jgi:hypothetical protein